MNVFLTFSGGIERFSGVFREDKKSVVLKWMGIVVLVSVMFRNNKEA